MTPLGAGPSRVRGDLVLHPVALASLALLLVNDHVLKAAAPGWVTGKLSDVAGLALVPFLVLAARDVLLRRPPRTGSAAVVAAVTALAFSAVKLWSPARRLYCATMGALRYPVDLLVSRVDGPVPLVVVPDATDLVAVVACGVVVLVVWRRSRTPDGLPRDRRADGGVGAGGQASSARASAAV